MRWLYGVEVSGLENVPIDGPAIISPNHRSFFDSPIAFRTKLRLSYKRAAD